MRALFVGSVLCWFAACPPAPCEPGDCACAANCVGDGGPTFDGGGDAGEVADAGTGWERYCASHRRAYCGALQRCGLFASTQVCEASLTAFDCGETPPGIADGRVRFDEAAAATCLSRLDTIACGDLDFVTCPGVLTGLGQPDASCFGSDTECAADLYCDSSMTCPGRCRPSAAVGETPVSGQPCVDGAYVYDGRCAARVAVGGSCAPGGAEAVDRECVDDAFCEQAGKTCEAKHAAGAACGSYFECRGVLQCNQGRCGGLSPVDTACDDSALCKSDLRCGDAGVCVSRGGAGAACAPETDECTLAFFCDSSTGTCTPYRSEGEACTFVGGECGFASGLFCTATFDGDGGACVKTKPPGEPCDAPYECLTGLCAGGQCVGCIDSTP